MNKAVTGVDYAQTYTLFLFFYSHLFFSFILRTYVRIHLINAHTYFLKCVYNIYCRGINIKALHIHVSLNSMAIVDM